MTFDVATFDVSDTTDVTLNHPKTGEPFLVDVEVDDGEGGKKTVKKPMSVTVYGPGSQEFEAAQAQSEKSFGLSFHRGKSRETQAQKKARIASFLSACTISFNNFTYGGGDPKDRETFRACYSDPKRNWLTEQVNLEMGDWSNF
ncbi:MAG: hypothetical protein Q8N10_03305 [Phenylobacterium sp.]|uniref:hypothetical protein n=1 Tax=Phenylobacterium sp. TaxID=1871053 RepID=UPI0027169B2E|nr:hypothetical protein [Phenylobacterium sp.]MDO8912297.1 hypothetical protein [Phenylobacterium sp.]MDP3099509.1 hypothetical protein [Phenylobacterium sp.]